MSGGKVNIEAEADDKSSWLKNGESDGENGFTNNLGNILHEKNYVSGSDINPEAQKGLKQLFSDKVGSGPGDEHNNDPIDDQESEDNCYYDHVKDEVKVDVPSQSVIFAEELSEYYPKMKPMSIMDRKSHECDQCGKEFHQLDFLKKHEQNHKLYSCDKCGKAFCTSSHLKRHSQTTKHKTFSCDKCEKSWNNFGYLHKHMCKEKQESPRKYQTDKKGSPGQRKIKCTNWFPVTLQAPETLQNYKGKSVLKKAKSDASNDLFDIPFTEFEFVNFKKNISF